MPSVWRRCLLVLPRVWSRVLPFAIALCDMERSEEIPDWCKLLQKTMVDHFEKIVKTWKRVNIHISCSCSNVSRSSFNKSSAFTFYKFYCCSGSTYLNCIKAQSPRYNLKCSTFFVFFFVSLHAKHYLFEDMELKT